MKLKQELQNSSDENQEKIRNEIDLLQNKEILLKDKIKTANDNVTDEMLNYKIDSQLYDNYEIDTNLFEHLLFNNYTLLLEQEYDIFNIDLEKILNNY